MPQEIPNEAEILQARERLARALTRLTTLVGGIPEQFQLLERSRQDAINRLKENAQLLESERAITSQRDSLSESAKAEIQTLSEKLKDAQQIVSEKDQIVADQEVLLRSLKKEIELRNSELISVSEQVVGLQEELRLIQDEHRQMVLHIESLREERDAAMKQVHERVSLDDTVALKFTQDERLQLLKTVDSLIEKVDHLSQNGNQYH